MIRGETSDHGPFNFGLQADYDLEELRKLIVADLDQIERVAA